jgi:hypothetical protein
LQLKSQVSPKASNRHSTWGSSSFAHAEHAVQSANSAEHTLSRYESHPPDVPVDGNLDATHCSHCSPVPSDQLFAPAHAWYVASMAVQSLAGAAGAEGADGVAPAGAGDALGAADGTSEGASDPGASVEVRRFIKPEKMRR